MFRRLLEGASQDRYEDDGTDRKKKGRKEGGRESGTEERKGVLGKVISSKNPSGV